MPPAITAATPETIDSFLRQLGAETVESKRDGEWVFANGESVFRCTTSARRIADAFGGRVLGFFREDNPTAEIATGEDGHDFALIGERFIVDYWGAYAAGIIDRPIFDLSDSADHQIISRLYGLKEAWRTTGIKTARPTP